MNYDKAKKLLNTVRPDPDASCFRERTLECDHKYDLDIIIPCYNVERYIESCINSVLHQDTSYSVRIIAINDGSKDSTLQILETFRKSDDFVLINQENKGISLARNRGLELVEAEYIMFLDSDDMLCPDAVETLISKAKAENADYVQGGIIRIMNDGSEGDTFGVSFDGLITSRQEITGIPGGKLFRSSLFRNLKFPEYNYEDSIIKEILFDIANKKISIAKPTYKYRVNPNSISVTSKTNYKCIDGLWINLKLNEDRQKCFKLEPDQDYYEYKISTYPLIYTRIKKKGIKLCLACFQVYSHFINSNFGSFSTMDKQHRYLEKSLKKGNFVLFLISRLLA